MVCICRIGIFVLNDLKCSFYSSITFTAVWPTYILLQFKQFSLYIPQCFIISVSILWFPINLTNLFLVLYAIFNNFVCFLRLFSDSVSEWSGVRKCADDSVFAFFIVGYIDFIRRSCFYVLKCYLLHVNKHTFKSMRALDGKARTQSNWQSHELFLKF